MREKQRAALPAPMMQAAASETEFHKLRAAHERLWNDWQQVSQELQELQGRYQSDTERLRADIRALELLADREMPAEELPPPAISGEDYARQAADELAQRLEQELKYFRGDVVALFCEGTPAPASWNDERLEALQARHAAEIAQLREDLHTALLAARSSEAARQQETCAFQQRDLENQQRLNELHELLAVSHGEVAELAGKLAALTAEAEEHLQQAYARNDELLAACEEERKGGAELRVQLQDATSRRDLLAEELHHVQQRLAQAEARLQEVEQQARAAAGMWELERQSHAQAQQQRELELAGAREQLLATQMVARQLADMQAEQETELMQIRTVLEQERRRHQQECTGWQEQLAQRERELAELHAGLQQRTAEAERAQRALQELQQQAAAAELRADREAQAARQALAEHEALRQQDVERLAALSAECSSLREAAAQLESRQRSEKSLWKRQQEDLEKRMVEEEARRARAESQGQAWERQAAQLQARLDALQVSFQQQAAVRRQAESALRRECDTGEAPAAVREVWNRIEMEERIQRLTNELTATRNHEIRLRQRAVEEIKRAQAEIQRLRLQLPAKPANAAA